MAGKLQKKMVRANASKVKPSEQKPMGLLAQQMADPMESQNVDPALKQQVDSVTAGLMKLVHSKETRDAVMEQLKTAPAEQSVPIAMMMVVTQFEQGAKGQGVKIPQDVKVAAYVTIILDLVDLGNAAGIFNVNMEDENALSIILENSLKMYIEKGLKDGSIDPIALQKQVEPLMSPDQQRVGRMAAEKSGTPLEPTEEMAQQKIIGDSRKPLEEENAKLKGLLAQAQQGPMQNQGGQV